MKCSALLRITGPDNKSLISENNLYNFVVSQKEALIKSTKTHTPLRAACPWTRSHFRTLAWKFYLKVAFYAV